MQSRPSIEGTVVPGTTDENVEGKQQKPKTLPCKFCDKRFRDLLVRHEKLVHLNEGSNKDGSRPRKPSAAGTATQPPLPGENHVDTEMMGMPRAHAPHYHSDSIPSSMAVPALQTDPRIPTRAAACNLDLLSDAATQIASANEVNSLQPMMSDLPQPANSIPRIKSYDEGIPYGDRGREPDTGPMSLGLPGQTGPSSAFDDYNLFMDEFATSSHFLPQAFEADQGVGLWPRGALSKPSSQFPSRFPSLAPDPRDPTDGANRMHDEPNKTAPMRVSAMDHTVIKNRLDEFSTVLPNDFVFPSRHTLTRFLEGYVSGFHEHLPILHLPTIAPADIAPELLLAILAVGAQYRFESHRSNALWYAARAVALEQIRRRHSHEIHSLLPTAAAYSPHSTRPSPSHGFRHSFSSMQQERPMTQDTHREPYSPNTPQSRMETIQALLLLFAVGLWGAKAILHEAMSLQSLLALLLWRAETAWQWQEARHSFPSMDISLQDAFARLFSRPPQGPPAYMSSLGNYILIHALLQHIFLLKQTSFTSVSSFEAPRGLRPDDVEECLQALRIWQMSFEQHQTRVAEVNPQGAPDSFPGGPVAYNSTALWRLASIRLYTDLSPSRTLETRDASQIAQAFHDAPYLIRSARSNRAVLQAIHALSMLVKLGVNYVARRKSSEWSMQHSLCNLECAILLSKWLLTLASICPTDAPPSHDERSLLEMLRHMLDETEFAVPIDPSLSGGGPGHPSSNMDTTINDNNKLRQLAAAVIRLWAETFKGSHIFDIVKVIVEIDKSGSRRRSTRLSSTSKKSSYFEDDVNDSGSDGPPRKTTKTTANTSRSRLRSEVGHSDDEDQYLDDYIDDEEDEDGDVDVSDGDSSTTPPPPPRSSSAKRGRGRPPRSLTAHPQKGKLQAQTLNSAGKADSATKKRGRPTNKQASPSAKRGKLATRNDSGDEDEAEIRDSDDDEDDEPKVTFIPLPKLRDTNGVEYENTKVHPNTLLFLGDLKANNKRSWLKMHDPEYRRSLKDWESFVETLTEKIIEADETVPELPLRDVIFRIYRDIRFSKDQTPYKPHYSAAWSRTGRKGPYACYYVHMEPGNCLVGGGLWHPEPSALAKLRASVDERPHRIRRVLTNPEFVRIFLPNVVGKKEDKIIKAFADKNQENALKTKPKGFNPDHRDLHLLKLRNYTIGCQISEEDLHSDNAQEKIMEVIRAMVPFVWTAILRSKRTRTGGDEEDEDQDPDSENGEDEE
ncbi:hypothetical protein GQX73_g759 [Xylaria multiplex]|uniref:Xylanolytic transcriptional activator regulatory domain-containing protein n=1 Tax=Xylaria multiplex TaxID=323545 RepID=A0A7C8IZ89_9PEZI|nr:hypothetical protein GQX73_g759 [Xylaria multiplex]